ncbi:MAG: hypothetical protein K2K98_09890 [Muribaculaceae bacterium]|nr:hypothetical protein [Muribaculaceae bacterium]
MNSKYVYAFAGLLLGLTACSNEDLISQSGQLNGETVFVSLKVDRNKAVTRTIINETDTENGIGLSNVWAQGDQVTLISATGAVAGTLTLEGAGGDSEGIFSGEATIADGEYTVWYLGADPAYARIDNGVVVNDLATAGCDVSGSFSDLNKGDLMNSKVSIIVKDGKATVAESVTLASQMAMAHFTLGMDGLDTALAAENAKLTLSYIVGETPYSYNITNKEADVYVPLFPGEYAPSFTLTSGDKTYTYAFANTTTVQAGLYYCGDKDSATGGSNGINVSLKDPSEKDPYEGYENEDPRNPLHKFAKYNLVRVGERGSLVNGFAESETENGALYQWGRNYGYMDTNGIYKPEIVSPDEDFTNYIDALGLFDDPDSEYDRVLDYYVYNPNSNRYFITSGTAKRYTPEHPQYSLWYDAPRSYSTVDDLKEHPDKYFMNGTPGTKYLGYGSYYMGLDQFNNQPDYWLSSFGNGGSTWEERAGKCGYTAVNPCPDGWRMPTLEEFKAIAPEGQGLDQNKNMATMLSNYAEVRKTKDGVNYVIRWIYDSSAITVEAVVVETAIAKSQVNSKFWDDNRDKKVVRVFPFTGSIVPLVSYADDAEVNNVYIMRPYHRGFLDIGFIAGAYGPANNGTWTLIGPGNNAGAPFGGYWIDEKNYAFKFEAKEISHGTNTSNKTFTATSCLFVGSAEPVMGYAIRPVMAK